MNTRDLANVVYDRAIDYMRNRARDNALRDEYDRYMSAQNYNNNEMNKLVDVITILVAEELRGSRSEAQDREILLSLTEGTVDAHVGAFVMSDRALANSVPDDVYRDLTAAESEWRRRVAIASDLQRGGGRGYGSSYGGGQVRSVFDNRADNSIFGRSGSVFDRHTEAPARNSIWDRPSVAQPAAARETTRANSGGFFDRAREDAPASASAAPAAARTQEPARVEGPDMSKENPYDDFWLDGEHWQLAHKSSFVWTFSTKQQTRRTYDPDEEICFLVKGKDGKVREEFLPVTAELSEEAHRIRFHNRPNNRLISEREESGDVFAIGEDLDAVDLDALNNTVSYVRKQYLKELDTTNAVINDTPAGLSSIHEAVLRVAGEANRHDSDVVSLNAFISTQLAADKATIDGLETLRVVSSSDGDLQVLAKRLKALRGVMAENVMNFLDEHFTNEVNSALRHQFGLAVSIDSFIEDFEALLESKTFKNLGSGAVAQFLSRTRTILASIHYLTELDQRMEIIDSVDVLPVKEDDPEQYLQFRQNVAVLFRPMALIHVKMDSESLAGIGKDVRTPARTGQHADPELATKLAQLLQIGRKTTGAGHCYLVTADNIMYELVPIAGARDVVGIRLV